MYIVAENCWICHARQASTQSHRETIDELVNDLFAKLASGKVTRLNHLICHVFSFLVLSPSMQSVCETCFESAWSWLFSELFYLPTHPAGKLRECRKAQEENLQIAAWHRPARASVQISTQVQFWKLQFLNVFQLNEFFSLGVREFEA